MEVFIAIDGYTLKSGFVIKEICYIYRNGDFNHYLIRNPERILSESERRTVRYTINHLNNLCYFDGDIPYNLISTLLEHLCNFKLYTYGEIAVKVLQEYLPNTEIENIQNHGYKMPATLPDSKCFRSHNQRYCAKAKAFDIKKYLGL